MGKLSSSDRKSLPTSDFGEPDKRAYPMPDKSHAANAKARATQQVKKGNLSPSTKAAIDAKADRILGDGERAHKGPPMKNSKVDHGKFS